MTSYPCNKYEQITPSYLLSVNKCVNYTFGYKRENVIYKVITVNHYTQVSPLFFFYVYYRILLIVMFKWCFDYRTVTDFMSRKLIKIESDTKSKNHQESKTPKGLEKLNTD